ncbi:MAG: HAMP domain-containing sensor histidine kinase [Patescibacteria group bacterium]
MRTNHRFVLVGVLVFVFPLLFVLLTQSFFDTAYNNVNTSEKRRVGLLHDSLAQLLLSREETAGLSTFIGAILKDNPDITKIRVVEETADGLQILAANDTKLLHTYEDSVELYRSAGAAENQSFIYEFALDNVRTWQAFRRVDVPGQSTFYIFSEHSFSSLDSVFAARQQQSYLGLTFILIFILLLTYWLTRQVNWHARYLALEAELKERDLLNDSVIHEFRTPLTVIKGYASLLTEDATLSSTVHTHATSIKTSADRLILLVNDFLEVARLSSGRLALEKKEIEVSTLITRILADMQSLAVAKQLECRFETTKRPVFLMTDEKRFTQVLTNLISNAIKYTDKGTVTVMLAQRKNNTTIRIKDTGRGISAADQKRLFTPFVRVGAADSSTVVGSGLGMWITKQIIDRLGGTISVESIEGVGTHVILTIKG